MSTRARSRIVRWQKRWATSWSSRKRFWPRKLNYKRFLLSARRPVPAGFFLPARLGNKKAEPKPRFLDIEIAAGSSAVGQSIDTRLLPHLCDGSATEFPPAIVTPQARSI